MLAPSILRAQGTPADPIHLDNNENPYGPFPSARNAVRDALAEGGRYPGSAAAMDAIARTNGIQPAQLMLTVGATEGLAMCAAAYTRPDAPLVTAAPTYAAIATATEALGHPVIRVPILADGGLDLGAMAERARGAGLVYLCNPNNPSGTLRTAREIEAFIADVQSRSPRTAIVIGEAYHEYIEAAGYATAVPAALARPHVIVNRTFSKLYGLAGFRLGYLIAQEQTLQPLARHRVSIGANALALAAAAASVIDADERARQLRLNRESRELAVQYFARRRIPIYPPSANYVFADVKRDSAALRATCMEKGLLVGRQYAPATMWMRLTIGTPEDMQRAFAILDGIL
jgi:histidinol-phosphate aminotransferase